MVYVRSKRQKKVHREEIGDIQQKILGRKRKEKEEQEEEAIL
jgi:hypothetical protein